MTLTQNHPAVGAVQVENPRAGDLRPVLHVLLQALAVDLQRVLVGEPADGVDVDGRFGFRLPHTESFLPDQFEHPVPSQDLLQRGESISSCRAGGISTGYVISYLPVNVDDPLSSSRAVFKLYPVDSITQRHLPHAGEVIRHPLCFQPAADQHKQLAGLIAW